MVPPLPPEVELLIAKLVLFPLFDTVVDPSMPVKVMVPPVWVERLFTIPSTRASSPDVMVMLPPSPPVVELMMLPRSTELAAATVTSLLAEVRVTVPPF